MKNQTTINGITYNILAETSFDLNSNIITKNNHPFVSLITLVRPKGNKRFQAMRDQEGNITLN